MFTPSSAFSSAHPVNDAPQPRSEEVKTSFHPNTPHLRGDDPTATAPTSWSETTAHTTALLPFSRG